MAVAAGAAMEIACSMTLRQEVENHRSRGRNLRLYEATPFSLEGGNVTFESLGFFEQRGRQYSQKCC